MNIESYVAGCNAIAKDAGGIIMEYFSSNFTTSHKDDNSPVTDADIAANNYITKQLAELAPRIPIIAEEDEEIANVSSELFWLVDPLDGTRSFISGEGEFTVNIGLIRDGAPIMGVIYIPVTDQLFYGVVGDAAWQQNKNEKPFKIATRDTPADGATIWRSQSHASPTAQGFLDTLHIKNTIHASSSLKFCKIANGEGDVYPRFGRTMEWDTAAGHAIVLAAGGRVVTTDNKPLTYSKDGLDNPAFIAYGK